MGCMLDRVDQKSLRLFSFFCGQENSIRFDLNIILGEVHFVSYLILIVIHKKQKS